MHVVVVYHSLRAHPLAPTGSMQNTFSDYLAAVSAFVSLNRSFDAANSLHYFIYLVFRSERQVACKNEKKKSTIVVVVTLQLLHTAAAAAAAAWRCHRVTLPPTDRQKTKKTKERARDKLRALILDYERTRAIKVCK